MVEDPCLQIDLILTKGIIEIIKGDSRDPQ